MLPGGFSYGDYLRCGAIARFAPVMAPLVDAANGGLPVLGICNGFQVLCESHLLPGRARPQRPPALRLPRPEAAHREQRPRRGRRDYEVGQEIVVPLKNGEGGYVADEATLDMLEGEGRVVARYLELQPQRQPARHRRHQQRRAATSSGSCRTRSTRSRPSPARRPTVSGFFTSILKGLVEA